MEFDLFIRLVFNNYWWALIISTIIFCEIIYWTVLKDYNMNFFENKTMSFAFGMVITLILLIIIDGFQAISFNTMIKILIGLCVLIIVYVSNYFIYKKVN